MLDKAEEHPVPELDAFENLWFPIARASLRDPYPRIADLLFANVSQTRGPQSAIGVLHFLDRLGAMERSEEPFGTDGPAARQLLAERGLTRGRERAGQALLDRLREIESASVFPVLSADDETANVEAMWAWYLEWRVIARTAIKNQTLLKLLGFAPRRQGSVAARRRAGSRERHRLRAREPRSARRVALPSLGAPSPPARAEPTTNEASQELTRFLEPPPNESSPRKKGVRPPTALRGFSLTPGGDS